MALHLAEGAEGRRGPVTMVVGPGSSGESAVLQALVEAVPDCPSHRATAHRITAGLRRALV